MAPPDEYQFIISTDGSVLAQGLNRGHAIRTALRVASNGSTKGLTSSSEETVAMKGRLRNRFRLARKSDQERGTRTCAVVHGLTKPRASAPLLPANDMSFSDLFTTDGGSTSVQRFGNSTVDPFCSLPVATTSGSDGLLRYCKHSVTEALEVITGADYAM